LNYPATSCSSDWRVLLSECPSAGREVGRWWQDPQKRVDSQRHRCVSHNPENTSIADPGFLHLFSYLQYSRYIHTIIHPSFINIEKHKMIYQDLTITKKKFQINWIQISNY
jgi:hypothetical protein